MFARFHWLPIAQRIEFKINLLTFKALSTHQPDYLSELLNFHTPARHLRSSERKTVFAFHLPPQHSLLVPVLHLGFGTTYQHI